MAKDEDIMYGPFTVEVGVYLSNGTQVAIAKCNMPVGEPFTIAGITAMMQEAERVAQQQSPEFKLMGRDEFENAVMAERTGGMTAGQHFATKSEWDKPPDGKEKEEDSFLVGLALGAAT